MQAVFAAADDSAGRSVLAGNLDVGHPVAVGTKSLAQSVQKLLHTRPVEADSQHAAGSRHALLVGGAVIDKARRIGERKSPTRIGRGHLAGAVAQHAVGIDTPGPEEFHQGALEREDRGLGQGTLVKRFLWGFETGVSQRGSCMLAPVRVHGVDDTTENGMGLVEVAAATSPLCPLSGKHHDQSALALVHCVDGGLILREVMKRLGQIRQTVRGECRPCSKVGAAAAEVAGERIEIHRLLAEQMMQTTRTFGQCPGGARRERDHETRLRRQRHRPEPGLCRSILAHHAVSVRASKSERIDPDDHRVIRKGFARCLDLHGAAVEVDFRIGYLKVVRCRCEGAPLHHQNDLQQGAVEGGGLHVSDVALHAGDSQRNLAFAVTERFRDGVSFDGVAYRGPGCVGLDVVEIDRAAAGACCGFSHQLDLAVVGGCADEATWRKTECSVGRPGRVDCCGFDHGVDWVPVPLGCRKGLDGKDERTFGTHVSVGPGIEGMTLAVRADDPHEVETAAHSAASQVGHGADKRLVAIAALQRIHRCVQGAQAGGAGRAVGGGGPHEVKVIGDPVGQHGKADAGNGVLRDPMLWPPVGDGRDLRSDEDPGGAVA